VHLVSSTDTTTASTSVASTVPTDVSIATPLAATAAPAEGGAAEVVYSQDPGPILPEMKEVVWGGGAFIVFAILMRFFLFPRLKKSMDARYHGIRSAHEAAEAERSSARAEVADYEAQLAGIRAEAAKVVDGARSTLEAERQARLAEVNGRIAQRRDAANAQADAARAAARDQIAAAVSDVASTAGELATGRRPSADVVSRVVNEVMAR
jgi:F-type H+-transporting ATPase subunit b